MTIPLHELNQRFTDTLFNAPYAQIFQLDDVLQAGAQLQRLAQSLAPLVPGGLTFSAQDVQHLAKSYADYYVSPHTESPAMWSVKQLLEHSPGLNTEGLQHLAQDLETITAAVQETARPRATAPLSGAAGGESGRARVRREEQEHGAASARGR